MTTDIKNENKNLSERQIFGTTLTAKVVWGVRNSKLVTLANNF